MTLLRLMWRFVAPYWRWLLALFVLQGIQTVTQLEIPKLLGDVVDRTVRSSSGARVWPPAAWMLALSVLTAVVSVGAIYCGSRAAFGLARDLRATLFTRILGWSAREHALFGAASLTTRLTNDVQQVQMLVGSATAVALLTPLTVAGGVGLALRQDVDMAQVLLIAVLAMVGAMGVLLIRMVKVATVQQAQVEHLNAVAREQITGLRVVRAFVREAHEASRFGRSNLGLTQSLITNGRLNALLMPLIVLVLNLASAAVVWVGAQRVNSHAATVGEVVAFLNYLGVVLVAVIMAAFTASMVPRAAACAARLQQVLDVASTVDSSGAAGPSAEGPSQVRLETATFAYPGAESPVLQDIDLTLEPGKTVAVVGSTGAGKSTLVNLVARLLDVTGGAVMANGRDARSTEVDDWRRHFALVPQRALLFSGTVAENVRHGRPDATDDEVWEALEAAQAAEFVRALPQGLAARVAQGGSNFSGGQRQRLAIARALIRRASFYLFDDSFSALDTATEARLRQALHGWTKGAGILVVAQRVSSIADSDEIVVLDGGHIVGRGTHADLLSSCVTYAEILQSQASLEAVR